MKNSFEHLSEFISAKLREVEAADKRLALGAISFDEFKRIIVASKASVHGFSCACYSFGDKVRGVHDEVQGFTEKVDEIFINSLSRHLGLNPWISDLETLRERLKG